MSEHGAALPAAVLVAALAWGPAVAPDAGGAPLDPGEIRRIAPLEIVREERRGALSLGEPRVVDRIVAGPDGERAALGRVTLEALELTLSGMREAGSDVVVKAEILPMAGEPWVARARLEEILSAGRIRIPFEAVVPPESEGPFSARVTLETGDGTRLFEGHYGLGYPRYHGTSGMERVSCSATIRDDFDGPAINEDLWRIWRSDPDRFETEQRDGRYWIRIRGEAGYNGLSSRVTMPTRDVEAVCRTGIESPEGALHASLMHLCGSGEWSPDHWYEIHLRDAGGAGARATAAVASPATDGSRFRGPYDLPLSARDGYLQRIVCDGSTHLCVGYVKVHEEWWQIGDPLEVPARRTKLEIKTTGPEKSGRASTIWFDDCRVYPRPETHFVSVVLQRPDGRIPGAPQGGADLISCFDDRNVEVAQCDLTVGLFAQDGRTLVDEAHTRIGFGYAVLSLDRRVWDVYPAAAVIRVFANGRQLGPDHRIERHGVEGLYPDDVYRIRLR